MKKLLLSAITFITFAAFSQVSAQTPHTNCDHAAGNSSAYVKSNEGDDCLDNATMGTGVVDFATDANRSLTAAEMRGDFFIEMTSTGSLTATRDLTLPSIQGTKMFFNNTTGGQIIQIDDGGTTVDVPNGSAVLISTDGTDVEQAQFAFNNLTTSASTDTAADSVAVFDASAAAMREILLDDLGITGAGGGGGGGTNANPDWEVISETSHSGAATVDLAFDPTIYEEVEITLRGITVSTDGTDLEFNVTDDAFVSIETGASAYSWGLTGTNPEGPTANVTGDDADGEIKFTPAMDGTAAESRGYARILIAEPGGDGDKQFLSFASGTNTTPNGRGFFGHSLFKDNTNTIDGIRLKTGGGNFAAEITVRGRRINPIIGAVGLIGPLLWVGEEQTSGTTCTDPGATGWQERDINVVHRNEIAGASVDLGANDITLPAGDYVIEGGFPHYRITDTMIRLRDQGGTATILTGDVSHSHDLSTVSGGNAPIRGKVLFAAETTFTPEMYIETDTSGNNFGRPDGAKSEPENCGSLMIWKVDEGRDGANPDWEHIETITLSGASTDFAAFDPSLYTEYEIAWNDVSLDTADDGISLRFSDDSGATFEAGASDYDWSRHGQNDAGTVVSGVSHASNSSNICNITSTIDFSAATARMQGVTRIGALDNSSNKRSHSMFTQPDGTDNLMVMHSACRFVGNTNNIDAIRVILPGSGTFSTGTAVLRARRKNPQTGPILVGQWEEIVRLEEAGAATMDFDWTVGNYEILKLECADIVPATDNQALWLRVRQSATEQSGASDYEWVRRILSMVASPIESDLGDNADAQIVVGANLGNTTDEAFSGVFTIFDPDNALKKRFSYNGVGNFFDAEEYDVRGAGVFVGNTTAIDGVSLQMASGNIAGNCTLLGRRR